MRSLRAFIALAFSLALALLVAMAVYRNVDTAPPPAPVQAEPAEKPRAPASFSQRIPKGMRAVILAVDNTAADVARLGAGDHVDVLAVTTLPAHMKVDGKVARLLLSGVKVLQMPPREASRRKKAPPRVALAVTPQQAAVLATADPAATLRLVMRNPGDDAPTTQPPTAYAADRGLQAYTRQPRDLAELLGPGMRAVTLDVAPTDGVGGVFRPGDRVDVLAVAPFDSVSMRKDQLDVPGREGKIEEAHRRARIQLQNVTVIATDLSLRWQSDVNTPIRRVTLALSHTDAEKLTVLADAYEDCHLRLIARNPSDHGIVATKGVELLDVLVGRRPYLEVHTLKGGRGKRQTFYQDRFWQTKR